MNPVVRICITGNAVHLQTNVAVFVTRPEQSQDTMSIDTAQTEIHLSSTSSTDSGADSCMSDQGATLF